MYLFLDHAQPLGLSQDEKTFHVMQLVLLTRKAGKNEQNINVNECGWQSDTQLIILTSTVKLSNTKYGRYFDRSPCKEFRPTRKTILSIHYGIECKFESQIGH